MVFRQEQAVNGFGQSAFYVRKWRLWKKKCSARSVWRRCGQKVKTRKRAFFWVVMIFVMTIWTAGAGHRAEAALNFAEQHGALSISGTKLVDAYGKEVRLQGVSTHGLAWFPQYVNKEAFQTMRDQWNVNCVRLALYTEEYAGYCTGDENNKQQLEQLIDAGVSYAQELGMYVIIDWHILNDQSPLVHKKEAKQFFRRMARKYDGCNNVIFEICNEPNGATTWSEIKKYAKEILKVIRKNQKKGRAMVIVGTPQWSQDVDVAASSPLKDDHVLYAFHFYAATHKETYREKVKKALEQGLPIIVSEFSICDASGNGTIDYQEANTWKRFLKKNNISMCAWNLSNKAETSALLRSDCEKLSGWKKRDLSETGKWLLKAYKN